MNENKIKQLILEIKQGNEQATERLLDEMLQSKFYVVYHSNTKELVRLTGDNQTHYYALSTDLQECLKFQGDIDIQVLSFRDFIVSIKEDLLDIGLVINPFGMNLNFNAGFLKTYQIFLKEREK